MSSSSRDSDVHLVKDFVSCVRWREDNEEQLVMKVQNSFLHFEEKTDSASASRSFSSPPCGRAELPTRHYTAETSDENVTELAKRGGFSSSSSAYRPELRPQPPESIHLASPPSLGYTEGASSTAGYPSSSAHAVSPLINLVPDDDLLVQGLDVECDFDDFCDDPVPCSSSKEEPAQASGKGNAGCEDVDGHRSSSSYATAASASGCSGHESTASTENYVQQFLDKPDQDGLRNYFEATPQPDLSEGVGRFEGQTLEGQKEALLELHQSGNCKPCAYNAFQSNGCRHSESCRFCHHCTPEEAAIRIERLKARQGRSSARRARRREEASAQARSDSAQ
eukprot:TRINITY_DN3835_c0_g2_i3.p1 TRINITY_DN3835_c0_g2~~TRINITY_DN3835_c0_g2_i3.p1  ORF type:complete len:337 (+),score=51.14 TRINITY_DN3835_c0_g2_i3:110-1120(+)